MLAHLLVGTFNTPALFTLTFDTDTDELKVVHRAQAKGAHSWLALNKDRTVLYATSWTTPPGLAAYSLSRSSSNDDDDAPVVPRLIGHVETASRSGYVCCSDVAVYSAGGASGEVYSLSSSRDGGNFLGAGLDAQETPVEPLQRLSFVSERESQRDNGGVLDFGGLRHGAHSADLSPDGRFLYVADIGRNAVFTLRVVDHTTGKVEHSHKLVAPQEGDGPRHVWPHPNGTIVYSLQEHSSRVDAARLDPDKGTLEWVQGVKIIPAEMDPKLFWADEVRLSTCTRFLYASTRGLEPTQRGYVAVFALSTDDGLFASSEPVAMLETRTSGGWANAIEPAPAPWSTLKTDAEGRDLLALTDSEDGTVAVLSWDGKELKELAIAKLDDGAAGAATAVWL